MSTEKPCLIAFLGTGNYQSVTYRIPEGKELTTAYCPVALAHLYGCAQTIVLATQEAKEKHGEAIVREFSEHGLAHEFRLIPSGRQPEELRELFETLREAALAAPTQAPLLIDITHGFRSQPFFVGTLVQYLNALHPKRLSRLRLFYGAFEARAGDIAPIWELTPFVEYTALADAIGVFLKTGHGSWLITLMENLGQRLAKAWAETKSGPKPAVKSLAGALRTLADAIDAVRINELLLAAGQEKSAVACVIERLAWAKPDFERESPLLLPVLQRLEEQLRPLCLTQDHLAGEAARGALLALARLYLDWGRLPEAAIVLREAWTCLYATPEAARPGEGFDENARRHADRHFTSAHSDIARSLAEVRNDIEHGGFRKRPLPAKTLSRQLAEAVETLASADTRPEQTRGRVWFVSRHPGAIEWAARQNIQVDQQVPHLDVAQIEAGDIVIGTLPVHLAAEVCKRRARFFNLSLDLPPQARGMELTADDLERYGARIEEYDIRAIATPLPQTPTTGGDP